MPEVRKHCNVYGFLGFFTAITCGIAWVLVNGKDGQCVLTDLDTLQVYHLVGLVAGIVICVLGFFNFANFLYDIVIVFYIAVVAIACLGGLMAYAAYFSFFRPCVSPLGLGLDIGSLAGKDRNVFSAEDGAMIGVFILNICSALMLLSAAGNFSRRT
jgi:hypothetical protein